MSADFFEPDHIYAYEASGFTAPELVTLFRVVAHTAQPETGAPVAFGWIRGEGDAKWSPYAEPGDDWPSSWTDVTEQYGEKATAPAATATPAGPLGAGTRNRLALLRRAVIDYQGEWSTGRAQALYQATYGVADWRATARRDLAQLHADGLLVEHDEPNHHHYTFNTRNGGASHG
jgi:hypothetical protein